MSEDSKEDDGVGVSIELVSMESKRSRNSNEDISNNLDEFKFDTQRPRSETELELSELRAQMSAAGENKNEETQDSTQQKAAVPAKGYWKSLIEGLKVYRRRKNGRILGEDSSPTSLQMITSDFYMKRYYPHIADSFESARMQTDANADVTYLPERLRVKHEFSKTSLTNAIEKAEESPDEEGITLELGRSKSQFINGLKSIWHNFFAAPVADSIVGSDGKSSKLRAGFRTIPVVLYSFVRSCISSVEYLLRYLVVLVVKLHRYTIGLSQKRADYQGLAYGFYNVSEAPEVIGVMKAQLELDGITEEKDAYRRAQTTNQPALKPAEVKGDIPNSKKRSRRLFFFNGLLHIFIKIPIETIANFVHYTNIVVFDTISGLDLALRYPGSGGASIKFRRVGNAFLNNLPLALAAIPFAYFAVANPAGLASVFTGSAIASSAVASIVLSFFAVLALPLLCWALQYGTGRMMVAIVDRGEEQEKETEKFLVVSKSSSPEERSLGNNSVENSLSRFESLKSVSELKSKSSRNNAGSDFEKLSEIRKKIVLCEKLKIRLNNFPTDKDAELRLNTKLNEIDALLKAPEENKLTFSAVSSTLLQGNRPDILDDGKFGFAPKSDMKSTMEEDDLQVEEKQIEKDKDGNQREGIFPNSFARFNLSDNQLNLLPQSGPLAEILTLSNVTLTNSANGEQTS